MKEWLQYILNTKNNIVNSIFFSLNGKSKQCRLRVRHTHWWDTTYARHAVANSTHVMAGNMQWIILKYIPFQSFDQYVVINQTVPVLLYSAISLSFVWNRWKNCRNIVLYVLKSLKNTTTCVSVLHCNGTRQYTHMHIA